MAGTILLALEVAVELSDGIHNPKEKLSAHPITAPKCFVAVQWSVGEVVGVEHAIAFQTMPILVSRLDLVFLELAVAGIDFHQLL